MPIWWKLTLKTTRKPLAVLFFIYLCKMLYVCGQISFTCIYRVVCNVYSVYAGWLFFVNINELKQRVTLTGHHLTVPLCSVGRRTGHASGPVAADRPRSLQAMADCRRR